MQVVNYIKHWRYFLQMSQDDLAKKTGLSQNTISNLETGKYQPTLKNAYLIADAFGQPVEEVFKLK